MIYTSSRNTSKKNRSIDFQLGQLGVLATSMYLKHLATHCTQIGIEVFAHEIVPLSLKCIFLEKL